MNVRVFDIIDTSALQLALKVVFAEQYPPPVSILHAGISTTRPLAAVVLLCKLARSPVALPATAEPLLTSLLSCTTPPLIANANTRSRTMLSGLHRTHPTRPRFAGQVHQAIEQCFVLSITLPCRRAPREENHQQRLACLH